MKKHRLLIMLLVLAMLMSACSGTTPDSNAPAAGTSAANTTAAATTAPASTAAAEESRFNEPGVLPVIKETVPLTIAIQASANVEDYDTNRYTQMIKERVNVDITFELLPAATAEARQKLALSISGGAKLADIVLVTLEDSSVFEYGTQGTFIPLNDLYEKYGYYFKQAMERNDNDDYTIPLITMPDGNMYTLPLCNYVRSGPYTYLGWINQTWLTEMNLEKPTTTAEYYDVLKAFKDGDPNSNGKADEIPMTGFGPYTGNSNPFIYLMNSFIQTQATTYLSIENGVLSVPFNKPEWLEGLKYMNTLVSEGLMDAATFTQDEAQFKALINNEEIPIVGSIPAIGFVIYGAGSVRMQDMTHLAPLTGPTGVGYAHYSTPIPSNKFYITKDCADPEAAFMLGDYMMSYDATVWNRFGEPEVDFTTVDKSLGVFSAINPNVRTVLDPILVWGSVQNSHWFQGAAHYRGFEDIDLAWSGDPWDQNYTKANALKDYMDRIPEQTVSKLSYTADELKRNIDISTTLIPFVEETATRLITGNESFDYWDRYLAELEKMGMNEYVELAQAAYDRMYK